MYHFINATEYVFDAFPDGYPNSGR